MAIFCFLGLLAIFRPQNTNLQVRIFMFMASLLKSVLYLIWSWLSKFRFFLQGPCLGAVGFGYSNKMDVAIWFLNMMPRFHTNSTGLGLLAQIPYEFIWFLGLGPQFAYGVRRGLNMMLRLDYELNMASGAWAQILYEFTWL